MSRQFDVERVNISESLEKDTLALHHGLAGHRSDITQPQDSSPIADHRNQVALCGVLEYVLRVLLDLKTGPSHAGSIGKAEIALRSAWLGGNDLHLTRPCSTVIVKRILFQNGHNALQMDDRTRRVQGRSRALFLTAQMR